MQFSSTKFRAAVTAVESVRAQWITTIRTARRLGASRLTSPRIGSRGLRGGWRRSRLGIGRRRRIVHRRRGAKLISRIGLVLDLLQLSLARLRIVIQLIDTRAQPSKLRIGQCTLLIEI